MLARRSTSDLSSFHQGAASASAPTSPLPSASGGGTPMRLKMRLPKAHMEKLMGESRDATEAAAKIMDLCTALGSAKVTSERPYGILRSRRFAATPEWGSGFMLQKPATGPAKMPQRWPLLPRTREEICLRA